MTPQRPQDMAVSGIGTIEVARVIPTCGPEPFIAASMYARWFSPHPTADGDWIYPDASGHRIISDLSAFIGYYNSPAKHRVLAAGDLNMSFQSTDPFDHRAQTVLDERMRARRPRSGTRSDSRTCKIVTGSKLIYASNQTVSHAIIPPAGADICRYSRGRSAYVADRAVCRMHQAWKSRRKEKIFVLCNAPGG